MRDPLACPERSRWVRWSTCISFRLINVRASPCSNFAAGRATQLQAGVLSIVVCQHIFTTFLVRLLGDSFGFFCVGLWVEKNIIVPPNALGCPDFNVQFVQLMCNRFTYSRLFIAMCKMRLLLFVRLALASLCQPTLQGRYLQCFESIRSMFDIHYS